MIFTSFIYIYFFLIVFTLYWVVGNRRVQNSLLLVASYMFYGWVTPWFCLLLATSTIVDYCCGLGMSLVPARRKIFLIMSLTSNLGMLAIFKYFNFFYANVAGALTAVGFGFSPFLLQLALPVGISFYTFQTLSYTIDIYRGHLTPRRDFVDFALFVSFFPQLVAGPIERAKTFLPQVERKRVWNWDQFNAAWPLILRGFFKKLVIADNISFYVDKVFMLETPGPVLLFAGTLAFSLQIFADFSGYTDIARGTARMFGFELMRNFHFPYFALTPSDFWRRWHISLSSWIRDYIYIPLGGSKQQSKLGYALVIMVTMLLCGLWHGAAWNYILWGGFHGVILFIYHIAGLGGKWQPGRLITSVVAWVGMTILTLFGWLIFRAPSLDWLFGVLNQPLVFVPEETVIAGLIILYYFFYLLPLGVLMAVRKFPRIRFMQTPVYAMLLLYIVILHSETGQDFIYFQF